MDNEVKKKVLSILRSIAEGHRLEWVEVRTRGAEGTVRFQPPGRCFTLLKLVYEFEAHRCRLLLYREGSQVAGRCGIDYDDGAAIEQFLRQVRTCLREICRQADLADGEPAMRHAPVSEARRFLLAI